MDPNHSYHLPSSIEVSFKELINTYNNEKVSSDKTKNLKKINLIIQDFLRQAAFSLPSQETAQEVKNLLQQLKIQPEDQNLWKQIMQYLDNPSPHDIRYPELLEAAGSMDIYSQMMGKVIAFELLDSNPSPEQTFEAALQFGEEINTLNLPDFTSLDNEKLRRLQQACPNLRSLTLSGTTPIEKLDLSFFSKLEKLNVELTNIASLDKLPKNLKELNLNLCRSLTAESFQKLDESFSKLEKLYVGSTDIASLDKLPKNLKELNLNLCRSLTAESLQKLDESFSKLEKLNVGSTDIASLDKLPKNLKELNLAKCYSLTTESFQKLDESFSKLEKLNVGFTNITSLDKLPKSLKELDLERCQLLTAQSFQKLDESFSKLEKLNVRRSTDITSLDKLPKSLKKLDLSYCNSLTAESFQKLDESFSKLEKLNVGLTNIASLDKLPKNLKELSLLGCRSLTTESIQKLDESFSKLEKLNVT